MMQALKKKKKMLVWGFRWRYWVVRFLVFGGIAFFHMIDEGR